MTTRIYVRVSTKDQNAERALDDLKNFAQSIKGDCSRFKTSTPIFGKFYHMPQEFCFKVALLLKDLA